MSLPCHDKRLRWVQWILRVVLVSQAIGLATRYLFTEYESESDVYGWLYFDYEFPPDATEADQLQREQLAQRVDDIGNWLYLVVAGVLFVGPLLTGLIHARRRQPLGGIPALIWQGPLLLYLAAWPAVIGSAEMVRDGDLFARWALGEQAVRILAPLALLMLLPRPGYQSLSPGRVVDAIGLLRAAAAVTFVVHGLKALYLHGPFVDLLLHSSGNLLGEHLMLDQDQAAWALRVIGILDIVVALLLVTTRLRVVALYMAFWGLVTAASRMTATGLGPFADPFTIGRYGEFLIRAANGGVPLAVFLFWRLSHRSPSLPHRTKEPERETTRIG